MKGRHAPAQAGFTLIELMIALVLGLIVIAGVMSVFLAGQQSYRTNQALGDVQDSSRTAFELMARDIRDAGLTGCGNRARIANVVSSTAWWNNWNNAVYGYGGTQGDPATGSAFGTSSGDRVSATDSLAVIGADSSGVSVKLDTEPAATISINETGSTLLGTGDIIVVCDPDHAAITQVTNYSADTITHAKSGNPGNCTTDLSYPSVCSSANSYVFQPNSQIAKLTAADWYVGYNGSNNGVGKSLYRIGLTTSSGIPSATTKAEMVHGVTGMSLAYHVPGNTDFVAAGSISNWSLVDAVRVTLTLESTDQRAGTNAKPLTRSFTATTTVRNRVK